MIAGLTKIFISLEILSPAVDSDYVVSFAAACFIVGICALVFDLCYLHANHKSILKLRHSWTRTPILFLTWPIGSCFYGYIALVLHILQPSMLGSLAAGITWVASSKSIFAQLTKPSDPEEDLQNEEES